MYDKGYAAAISDFDSSSFDGDSENVSRWYRERKREMMTAEAVLQTLMSWINRPTP
jgi:hypothetical protein